MIFYDSKTALVVVDMQNDFADPKGTLYVTGAPDIIEPINEEILEAKKSFAHVIYTRDWHPYHTPHFEKDGGPWPTHCVATTWGADFVDGLIRPLASQPQILKGPGQEHGYSAFDTPVEDLMTGELTVHGLDEILKGRKVTKVIVVGLATDYCVGKTAIDSAELGYQTTVIPDLVRPVNLKPNDGMKAIIDMEIAGVTFAPTHLDGNT